MQKIYGATSAEWDHFAGKLDLRQDLLPVVSDPTAEISENSRMKDKGKTPSIFNRDGKVVGMPQWTTINADDGDIRRWSRNDRLGICIQTRYARAIDIDVADPALADAIEQAVKDAVPSVRWATRFRANSGKRLMPFIYEGALYKRSFPIDAERVELLAYGQQFIAVGTHPSGVRYEWRDGLPEGFPVLNEDEVETLWDALEMLFATGDGFRARVPREGGAAMSAGEATDDPVLDYLAQHGLILDRGPSDQAYIDCPWASDHSSDNGVTQTAYFPAGTGGYARGHFKCLHDHCAGRTDAEFAEALGYEPEGAGDDDFEDFSAGYPDARGVTIGSEIATRAVDRYLPAVPALQDGRNIETAVYGTGRLVPIEQIRDAPLFRNDANGFRLVTQDNVTKAFEVPAFCGRKLKWDTFRDCVVWADWNEADLTEQWEPWADVDYARAARTLDQRAFKTTPGEPMIRKAIMDVAMRNKFDTARAWLGNLEWDGVPRLDGFLTNYLKAEDTPYARAVSAYMWTALAGRVMNPGCKADMAIILVDPESQQQKQGNGKTSLVESLVPFESWFGEVDFGMKEEEAGRIMRGKVVIELPELNGLRGKALTAVKKFISRRVDEWTPKYVEMSRSVERRSIFIGTTNEDQFLNDPTGERRWLPIVIGQADVIKIAADREQLWAEGLVRHKAKFAADRARGEPEYRCGIEWAEAETLAKDEHVKFKEFDEWDNAIELFLAEHPDAEDFTTAEVFSSMNRGLPTRGDEMRLGSRLRAMGFNNNTRKRLGSVFQRVWSRM